MNGILRLMARIRECPKCKGDNSECPHCGGVGADTPDRPLNIIGARKSHPPRRSKRKRSKGKSGASRIPIGSQVAVYLARADVDTEVLENARKVLADRAKRSRKAVWSAMESEAPYLTGSSIRRSSRKSTQRTKRRNHRSWWAALRLWFESLFNRP